MAVYKINSKKKLKEVFDVNSLSFEDLVDILDYVRENYKSIISNDQFNEIVLRNGANLNDNGVYGIFTSMNLKEIRNAYNEIRRFILKYYNEWVPTDMPRGLQNVLHLKRAYVEESLKESSTDPREYDLTDLGLNSTEESNIYSEARYALIDLFDSLGCDPNTVSQYSRWGRVVEDIAYLVAAYKQSYEEPHKGLDKF